MAFQKTKRRISFFAAGWVIASLVLAGCVKPVGEPPAIRYGRDLCVECNMIISEDRFAAAAAGPEGGAVKFDSLGCLLRYRRSHPELARFWVKSYSTAQWLEIQKAFFVYSNRISAPMGYGLAAESEASEAQKLAGETSGRVFDWTALTANFETTPNS